MEGNGISGLQTLGAKPGRSLAWLITLLFCLSQHAWGAGGAVEVRRVGLSKVGDYTLLTVVLDRTAEARVTPQNTSGKPQLVVDFPQARAAHLPFRLEGDEFLVEQVRTETSPLGGVRFILDLFPDQPYNFWKQIQKGAGSQTYYLVGLKADTSVPRTAQLRPPEPPPAPEYSREREPQPPSEDYGYQEARGTGAPGSFADLKGLIPKAGSLLQSLESSGWAVSEFHDYDRPGQRFARDFVLINHQYPELAVKIVSLQTGTPNTPNINIVSLTTDNLGGDNARQYRELRQWNFAKIKQKYEDIGDFFDEALKPLRVKLREETKALTLRRATVFQNFLQRACPENPQAPEQVMSHVREKVNPRFEGVQYTISENPLVILNMVDFLYVRVYFLEPR